jgi:uncharacterized protein YwbE
VLLADGKTAPISSLKPGDKVEATDTKTGKTQAETVTAVLVHRDADLYDLKVKEADGRTEVIDTTRKHLFWDPYRKQWRTAASLTKGEHLLTANGSPAVADGGTVPAVHDGWMWDLTVPGNNDHDFYVAMVGGPRAQGAAANLVSVLVHNINDPIACRVSDGAPIYDIPAGSKGGAGTGERVPADMLKDYNIGGEC